MFERKIMTNLFIFSCMDAYDFNLAVRSLASFLK